MGCPFSDSTYRPKAQDHDAEERVRAPDKSLLTKAGNAEYSFVSAIAEQIDNAIQVPGDSRPIWVGVPQTCFVAVVFFEARNRYYSLISNPF